MTASGRVLTAAVGLAVWLFACAGASAAGRPVSAPELRESDAVRGLSGSEGSERFFRVSVPSGARRLEVTTSGGWGDCDLYVRHGQLPSTRAYDARSAGEDADERVVIRDPQRGDWYILVHGCRAYRGVTLAVRMELGPGDDDHRVIPLANNVPVRLPAGERGSWRYYSIRVPPAAIRTPLAPGREPADSARMPIVAPRLTIRTTGGRGDCDLYVSRGPLPTPKSHAYASNGPSTEESISVRRPEAGVWFILVYGYAAYSGVDLVASYSGGPDEGRAEITEPDRRTIWRTGGEFPVRWRVGADVRRVQVQYSLDGGDTWALGDLPRSVAADRGYLDVRVPRERRFVTDDARVRLLDFDREAVLATSPRFRILEGDVEPPPPPPILRPDRHEPDGEAGLATRLREDVPQTHTIFPKGDQDWLELYPSGDGRYSLRLAGLSVALEVTVWSVSRRGEDLRLGRYDIGRGGGTVRIETARDTRYFRILLRAQDADDRGAYTISATRDGRE